MEARAPYGSPAAPPVPGPRNLAPPVAALLRTLGFQVWEQATPTPSLSLVSGTWTGLTGEQFHFQYAHHHPAGAEAWAACSMGVLALGARLPAVCFASTQVRRLKDVRLLVAGNDLFAAAAQRLAASRATLTRSHALPTP